MMLTSSLVAFFLSTSSLAPEGSVLTSQVTVWVDWRNTGFEDGSVLYPFNTIAEGIQAAPQGALVRILGGVYQEWDLNVTNDLTLEGEPDLTTVISAASSSGYGFLVQSTNSHTTLRYLRLEGNGGGVGFGTDNSSNTDVEMRLEHCIISNCGSGTYLNDTQQRGRMLLNFCTIVDCIQGVHENNGRIIFIENSIIARCDFAMAGLNFEEFEASYTLFDSNRIDSWNTGPYSGEFPTFGKGNVSGSADLNALAMHGCDSCARDMADPNEPYFNEPPPSGGRADVGAFGNSAQAPVGCGPQSGGCVMILPTGTGPGTTIRRLNGNPWKK